MLYLVDTDWAIHYTRGIQQVAQRIDELAADGIGLSIVSLAELYDGVFRAIDPQLEERRITDFLTKVEIINVDDSTCWIFARERSRLRAAGMLISDFDILIGSTAIRYGLTLLTNNRRHFERMRGLSIISA